MRLDKPCQRLELKGNIGRCFLPRYAIVNLDFVSFRAPYGNSQWKRCIKDGSCSLENFADMLQSCSEKVANIDTVLEQTNQMLLLRGLGCTDQFISGVAAYATSLVNLPCWNLGVRLSCTAHRAATWHFSTSHRHFWLLPVQGLDNDAKKELWPYLLGVFRHDSTPEQRQQQMQEMNTAWQGLLQACQVRYIHASSC